MLKKFINSANYLLIICSIGTSKTQDEPGQKAAMLHGIQRPLTLLCSFFQMGSTSLKGMSGLTRTGGGSQSQDSTAPSCPATCVSVGGIPLECSQSFRDRSKDLGDSFLSSELSCLFPVAAMEASKAFLSVLLQLKNNPCFRKTSRPDTDVLN